MAHDQTRRVDEYVLSRTFDRAGLHVTVLADDEAGRVVAQEDFASRDDEATSRWLRDLVAAIEDRSLLQRREVPS